MASTTFSIRIDDELLARIDQAAKAHGETRSTYILSWLPEYHDHQAASSQRDTPTGENGDSSTAR